MNYGTQPHVVTKNNNEFVFNPTRKNYVRDDAYIGTWYPTARPLHQYRLRGTSSSLPTYISASSSDAINLKGVSLTDVSTEWSISSSHPTETVVIDNGNGVYDGLPLIVSSTEPISYSYENVTYTLQNMIEQNDTIILTWGSGGNNMTWTSTSNTIYNPKTFEPCEYCKESHYSVGLPFKMLGKRDDGTNRWLSNARDSSGCYTCRPNKGPVGSSQGNIISFSGNANIRLANTHLSKNYYVSYSKYLHNRGKLYNTNIVLHRVPEIQYTDDGEVVWGERPQTVNTQDRFGNPLTLTLNSSYYNNNSTSSGCKLTVFNPSNREFATQGGVDAGTRLQRLKYNTIQKNNASIKKTYGANISYTENPVYVPAIISMFPKCNTCYPIKNKSKFFSN